MTQKQEVSLNTKSVENESGRSSILSFPRRRESRKADSESGDTHNLSSSGTSINVSSSGLTRGSSNKDSESGRSMVEMLGVLAIMGVLAIGGITGYRYAMDKYNANEILNEVRKRAVTASQQRILGRTIDLSEWNNTIQGHPVTTADNYNGDTSFFALTVSGIEKGVCDQVIKEKIPFAVEEKVGEVVVGEDTTCAEGNNDITFAFKNTLDGEGTTGGGEEPEPSDPAGCPAGTTSDAGAEGYGGGSFSQTVGGNIVWCYCPDGKKYNETTHQCDENIDNTCSSWTRNECGRGKYCQFRPGNCTTDPTGGVCQDLSACGEKGTYENFWMSDYGGSCSPDWWTAQAICASKGKRLVSLSDLGCSRASPCLSDTLTALRGAGLTYTTWTTDLYKENNPNSCGAFYVHLNHGSVSLYNRTYAGDVLCR